MSEYLRRDAAADYLRENYGLYTRATLAKLAVSGDGPPFRMFGRFPVYTREDLDEWIQSRLSKPVSSTAEAGTKRNAA